MRDSAPAKSPILTVDSEGLAWVTFADPDRRVNVLDEGVMNRLAEAVREVEERADEVRAVIFWSGKQDSFIAGADIEAIGRLEGPSDGEEKSRLGQAVYAQVEGLPMPTVAALHGVCLGGGLELALACRFRVASDHEKTKMGLPEVQLGLLPGWGGTTRLPRLVGLQASLDLLLTGKSISAARARRIGLVSEVLSADAFRSLVRRFALDAVSRPVGSSRPSPSLKDRLLEGNAVGRKVVFSMARSRVTKQTGGNFPAPLRILEVLQDTFPGPLDEAFAREAHTFGELTATAVHGHLLHLYHLREASKKVGRILGDGAQPREVRVMGVLGAGVMGGGIAQLAAGEGIEVQMRDIRDEAISGGLAHARSLFDGAVKRGKLDPAEADRRMAHISGGLELQMIRNADLVVEAIVERMDVKQGVLRETEEMVRHDCVIATNTSSLSVDEMAGALESPGRFCGLHFFNPVHRMPLVEIIRAEETTDDTLATVHALSLKLGKVPVICRDGAGFLVNRILGPYLNEAGHLISEGVPVEIIDRVAEDFGMPMGPVRLLDEVGIDIARHAGETLHEAFGERMAPSEVLRRIGDTDRLGRKNGSGFYLWEDDEPQGIDESVYVELGVTPAEAREHDRTQIRRRLVLAMINEAARVLEDGIVQTAGEVDLGMIMGTGFPPFRGGLLRFADDQHPRVIVERLRELESTLGARFTPAPVLLRAAEENRLIYDLFPPLAPTSSSPEGRD